MTGKQAVVEILERTGYIDNYYCTDHHITLRLSSIINRLRKSGWQIETRMEGTNCIYKLISKPVVGGLVSRQNNVDREEWVGLFKTETRPVMASRDWGKL